MKRVFVKLKDTSGSFYIASQLVSVNRTQIVEVEKDELVTTAIRNGGLVEVDETEYNEWKQNRIDNMPAKAESDVVVSAAAGPSAKEVAKEVINLMKEEGAKIDAENAKAGAGAVEGDKFDLVAAKELFEKAVAAGKATADAGKVAIEKSKFGSLEEAYQALVDNEKLRDSTTKSIG